MAINLPSPKSRALIVGASFPAVALVGYIDRSSPHIAFSIFYMVPIFLAAWFGSRLFGIAAAVEGAFAGLVADIWSIKGHHVFAYTNFGLRFVLFVTIAVVFSQLRSLMSREQALTEREREAAERLKELNEMKDALMRSVAVDGREPLGDIYARIVTLGFDLPTLTMGETRQVLNEIADASRRLSVLVNTLQGADIVGNVGEPHATSVQ